LKDALIMGLVLLSLPVTPRRRENWGGLPADVDVLLGIRTRGLV
jgi:hypothetical protein